MSKIEKFLAHAKATMEEQLRRRYQQEQQQLQMQQMHQAQQQQQQQYNNLQAFSDNQNPLSQPALLVEIDRLIDLTGQRKAYDSNDVDAEKQLAILSQLRKVISTQPLPTTMLPSIQKQLVVFSQKEMERLGQRMGPGGPGGPNGPGGPGGPGGPMGGPGYDQYPPYNNGPNGGPYGYNDRNYGPGGPGFGPGHGPGPNHGSRRGDHRNSPGPNFLTGSNAAPIANARPGGLPVGLPTGPRAQQQPIPTGPGGGASGTKGPGAAALPASLISSLTSAGLLNLNGSSRASSTEPGSRSGTPLTEVVDLNSISLQKPRPSLIEKLYSDIPNQCSNCGKRFRNDQQHLKSAHLDWHFRVNKRLLDENRSQSRCWYLTAEQWIEYKDEEEILGIAPDDDDGDKKGGSGKSKSELKELDLEELRNRKVIAPSDKRLAALPCPICQEKFNSVWDDDEEEWVWKNAMRVQNRIFHATCYAEAERSGGDLLQRILGTTPASSRPTPPPAAAPAPIDLASIIASVKRKAEENDNDLGPDDHRIKREKV
ncbi:Pcf11p [Sugiyamaella lignohabitans]|uniref:Pcf11p n=1 Tax=Sugiyamaella lignohabitans TaxID=796027 RepID=A0A167CDR9_9ASCO|nr:Pcf11p [Sugiyamaella lignohabitans]ANB11560.1 Pcf11p [Sugiyamaella lignohabitans]